MEHMLLKMARQLNDYDEASLTGLWERYARLVQEFEPSRRWEEAALVFSFIQAVRMKNQLFNHHLAENARRARGKSKPAQPEFIRHVSAWAEQQKTAAEKHDSRNEGSSPKKRRKVLHFRWREDKKPV